MNKREALENLLVNEYDKTLDKIDTMVKQAGTLTSTVLPSMAAGLGMWGAVEGVGAIREKMQENAMRNKLEASFNKVLKDNPDLEVAAGGKKGLKEMFDVYSDLAPNLAKHPMVIANMLRETGASGLTSMNPEVLSSLTGIEANVSKMKSRDSSKGNAIRALAPKVPSVSLED